MLGRRQGLSFKRGSWGSLMRRRPPHRLEGHKATENKKGKKRVPGRSGVPSPASGVRRRVSVGLWKRPSVGLANGRSKGRSIASDTCWILDMPIIGWEAWNKARLGSLLSPNHHEDDISAFITHQALVQCLNTAHAQKRLTMMTVSKRRIYTWCSLIVLQSAWLCSLPQLCNCKSHTM